MSIASEIARLQGVKSDILQAISDKGVEVPSGSKLDDCPDLIASISGGGGVPYLKNIMPTTGVKVVDESGYIRFTNSERLTFVSSNSLISLITFGKLTITP